MSTREVTDALMREVYEEMKTEVKLGMILLEEDACIDCPNVFRREDGSYVMAYVKFIPGKRPEGYETWMAVSKDLIHWENAGKLLMQTEEGWDGMQRDGSICLIDPEWEGSHSLGRFQGKVWMNYIGGSLEGYETDPLSIGMAYADEFRPGAFETLPEPVLTIDDPDVRDFEKSTLYKGTVIEDSSCTLGERFVMFYNAKTQPCSVERIGIAVSSDMVSWRRVGNGPCLENGIEDRWNIAGDPQIVRYKDLWVMHYFVAHAKDHPTAYDTFACSYDLLHWKKWEGKPLVESSEDYDARYAHKPYVIKENGIVYHYYCAVSKDNKRGIALAVSKDPRS